MSVGRSRPTGRAGRRMGPGWRCLTGVLALAGLLLASGSGRAELRRVEAVGIYGVREAIRTEVIVRDKAVENALWEGVSRVALERVGDGMRTLPADTAGDGEGTGPQDERAETWAAGTDGEETDGASGIDLEALRAALGEEVLPYTRSFRILEDQGEQPVLFDDDPETQTEYVVVVEVLVDVERVEAALEQAGWIASVGSAPVEAGGRLELELLGLERYDALEALMAGLQEGLGAERVQLLEASPARQVLAVEGRFDARELETWLARFRHPRLLLDSVGESGADRRLRVQARWLPPPEPIAPPAARKGPAAGGARRWGNPASIGEQKREAPFRN